MPYKKNPRSTRKPGYKPKGKPGVTNAVKKYVKKVTARTRPEMKCVKGNLLESTLLNTSTAAGSIQRVTYSPQMTQGVGRDQRIGNEVYIHGYHSKGVLNNTGATPVFLRRLVLGYSIGVNDSSAAALELFDNDTGAGVSVTTIGNNTGLITNLINKSQFKVYFDKTIKLSPSTATDGTQTKMFNYFQKFGGKKVKFEGNAIGTSQQDWRMTEIWLVAEAGNDSSTGTVVELSENFSTYFTDP